MNKRGIIHITVVMLVWVLMVGSAGCSGDLASGDGKVIRAADKWELSVESPRGTLTQTLTINKDLTGSIKVRDRVTPISNLKLEGDQLSFTVQVIFQDRDFTMGLQGYHRGGHY